MPATLDFPLKGSSQAIMGRCGPAVIEILQSRFGCGATLGGDGKPTAAPPQRAPAVQRRFTTTLGTGVRVSVCKADLTCFPAAAVVNAANTRLQHHGGLAQALSSAGGPRIQSDSNAYISKNGELKTGDAVVADAGNLRCQKIIHAVGPRLPKHPPPSELRTAEDLLATVIKNILDRVEEHRLQSVAIPAISSGIFNFPLPLCADTIVSAVQRFYEWSRPLRHQPDEIFLTNHDEPSVQEMERACRKILGSPSALVPSSPSSFLSTAGGSGVGGTKKSSAGGKSPSFSFGKVTVTLKTGQLELQQTDVIVNTASGDKNLNNGEVSRALSLEAGPGMQQELYGSKQKGPVIATKGHRLRCRHVYHTFLVVENRGDALQTLHSIVQQCLLMLQSDTKLTSITFPAIGAGGLGFSPDQIAGVMTQAVAEFTSTRTLDVHFVIYPSETSTYEAFEKHLRNLQKTNGGAARPGGAHDGAQAGRASTLSLNAASDEATHEAERWLRDVFNPSGAVTICNNFLLRLGEKDGHFLSDPSSPVRVERGRASVTLSGDQMEAAVTRLQLERRLCEAQKEFVAEEESEIKVLVHRNVEFGRTAVDGQEFTRRAKELLSDELRLIKMERVDNPALTMLFDGKRNQLECFTPRRMWQRVSAQFCDLVCRVGFHAEVAPPDNPAFGQGIYFTGSVGAAMKMWRQRSEEYLYLVEADVLTGRSTRGHPELILPPAVETDPQRMYDSVDGGPEVSVVFSGFQALPRYIYTCKIR